MSAESQTKTVKILLLVGRICLAGIFLFAAYSKMAPPPGFPWSWGSIRISLSLFANGVDSYQMLSPGAVSFVAHFLPAFELVLGLWLLSGIGLRISSLLSTLAICAFIYAMFSAWRRGLTINCGCFGTTSTPIGPKDMMRDGLLFLPLSAALLVGSFWVAGHGKKQAKPPASGGTVPPAQGRD
jgi:uncharacterized membrane protein YphA (DoxX/SURF4 family)